MKAKVNVIQNPKGKVKAFASVNIPTEAGDISVNDIRVIDGKNGLFISLPTRPYEEDGETKYATIVYIDDEELFNTVQDCILDEYEKATTRRKGGRR